MKARSPPRRTIESMQPLPVNDIAPEPLTLSDRNDKEIGLSTESRRKNMENKQPIGVKEEIAHSEDPVPEKPPSAPAPVNQRKLSTHKEPSLKKIVEEKPVEDMSLDEMIRTVEAAPNDVIQETADNTYEVSESN